LPSTLAAVGVAVDDKAIYWTDQTAGTVMKLAR
jgi:hypothetical protein